MEHIHHDHWEGLKNLIKETYGTEYEGCRNCAKQPEPLTMCEEGKQATTVRLVCPWWEPKYQKKPPEGAPKIKVQTIQKTCGNCKYCGNYDWCSDCHDFDLWEYKR